MRLLEFEGKEIFRKYGIPTPSGYVISNENDIKEFDGEIVLKAQVLIGGRGKVGGIKVASDVDDAKSLAKKLLRSNIRGFSVRKVLVEEKLKIEREYYLGITIDRCERMPLILASSEGGMDIEEIDDKKIYKKHINPLIGISPYVFREIGERLGLNKDDSKKIKEILSNLYALFEKEDATLAEINPLAKLKNGNFIAVDAKITIDSDALYRHPYLGEEDIELTALEEKAKEKNISFIQLDGDIGVIANGAGLTMATLDTLSFFNGKGGVFLDLGGTDDPMKVIEAFRLMKESVPKVILMNIFGGITKCDTVAIGVREIIEKEGIDCPVVARIKGLHEEKARDILRDAGIYAVRTLEEAAELTVKLEREVK